MQETFVKGFATLERGEHVLRLRPWLYRIAHNTSLNALRDRSLAHEELPEDLGSRRTSTA